jgi:hypothetical protein
MFKIHLQITAEKRVNRPAWPVGRVYAEIPYLQYTALASFSHFFVVKEILETTILNAPPPGEKNI